jgi:hypothetical protein
MLAYLLALVIAFGSLAIYLSAFFFPEIHRQNDFIWSGVGLFYALILWIFASRITGGLLLGHVASVSLLVWFGWQTLSLRRHLTPEGQQTPLPSPNLIKISFQEQISKFSLKQKFGQLAGLITSVFSAAIERVRQNVPHKPATATEIVPPSKLSDESLTVAKAIETIAENNSLSAAAVSQSPVLEMLELAPTPPEVIEEEEKQVIPPTETPLEAETETVLEVMEVEVFVSQTALAAETEIVMEEIQTGVVIAVENTAEIAGASEEISPNSLKSELIVTQATEKGKHYHNKYH